MDHFEEYTRWKAERANASPPEDFSSRLMAQVHLLEEKRSKGPVKQLLSQLDFLPDPVMRAAFAVGALVLGILRIYYISVNILVP